MGLIKIKVPLFYLILSAAVFLALGLFLRKATPLPVSPVPSPPPTVRLEELRQKDGQLVEPLLMVDIDNDEPSLAPLKSMIEDYLLQKEKSGEIRMASVYYKEFSSGRTFVINSSEQYSPASIMKIPTLITYLKDAQDHPGVLQQKYFFLKHFSAIPEQTITGRIMEENRYYTVQELLERMIIDSDNDAAALLNQHINMQGFLAVFRVLGFRQPDIRDWNYHMTATECSRFLRLLFNCTYLDEKYSEVAMQMLTKTKFNAGFTHDIDPSLVVAHKFGERYLDNEQQLHETGIFYLADKPYLLTVMTKGNDRNTLPPILAEVSRMTLSYMKNTPGS